SLLCLLLHLLNHCLFAFWSRRRHLRTPVATCNAIVASMAHKCVRTVAKVSRFRISYYGGAWRCMEVHGGAWRQLPLHVPASSCPPLLACMPSWPSLCPGT